jgi:hypothetical protein
LSGYWKSVTVQNTAVNRPRGVFAALFALVLQLLPHDVLIPNIV